MRLKLAIQKSGRLHDDSLRLLKECGIDIENGVNKLKAEATNFPIELFFLRDDDIPQYVEDGVADIGFVGENVVYEKAKKVEVSYALGFGKCRLSFGVRKNENFDGPSFLTNKKIATSYPVLVQSYLNQHHIQAEIHEISGSVEIAPGIGLADVICDLVSSGSTLFMNGLKEAETILESQAVLIKKVGLNEAATAILEKLLFRIESVKKAKKNKYVLLLPGMKSPTVVALATPGWSSVHSVIAESDFWELIEQLKAAGAEGILVVPIEKMIL
jgi:ATP phosphoribosyltransferase